MTDKGWTLSWEGRERTRVGLKESFKEYYERKQACVKYHTIEHGITASTAMAPSFSSMFSLRLMVVALKTSNV